MQGSDSRRGKNNSVARCSAVAQDEEASPDVEAQRKDVVKSLLNHYHRKKREKEDAKIRRTEE